MHCISPLLLLALLLCYSATLVSGSRKGAHQLHFIKEPESQLSRADGSRINFICNAHPPEATIKWLRNGSIIKNDDYEWIKVNGNKLILQVTKSFHGSSPHNHSHSVASSNEVYQCLAELGNLRIVSQPAKLIIGELNAFESPENSQDKTLTVIAGNTAVVPCDLPPGVPFVISEFEFGNMTIATSYDRYRLVPSGSLQIFHAKPIDSGAYRCVANNPYLAEKVYAHHFVNLKVIRHRHIPASERNKISWEVTPKKVTSSILGQNITIECVAKGHPNPKIYWERLNGQLDKERNHIDGGNLHITTLGKSDEGTYVCVASNGKHTLRAETNLEVSEIPQIVNSEPYEVLDVDEGHDLELFCEAKGFPRPFITWLHNGYIINNGQGPQNMFAFKNDDTVLMIRNANANHSGILQCFMTNQLGSTYSIKLVNHRGSQSEQMPSREDNEDLFLNADDDGEAGGTFEIRNGNHNGFDTTLANRAKKRKHKNMKLIPPNNPV
ncbi:PREDICTED: cell adhesion molecule-related/down-regulated by oncogenes-like, partial [Rhagoletis zephyria]|uniref:cell adhesion molecule-related/down-regulated by oncogenes-like n=1 Tax=Rhagoletis zephyria TaxID=28612 RepID=UPI0008114639